MKFDISKLTANWKTTLVGLLAATVTVLVAESSVPPGARRIAYVLAAGQALLGFLQKDAGGSPPPPAVPALLA